MARPGAGIAALEMFRAQNNKMIVKSAMSYLLNIVNEWPMERISASIILAFCCAAPLVWLFSNLVAYGLR